MKKVYLIKCYSNEMSSVWLRVLVDLKYEENTQKF